MLSTYERGASRFANLHAGKFLRITVSDTGCGIAPENLNRIFKKPFEFEFEWMDSIPPDKNGKLRMIVCNVEHN